MPRRNLLILIFVTLLALWCQGQVQRNPYVRVLAEAMNTIEQRALEKPESQQLFEGAMKGMFDRLDDYSAYVSPAELAEFHENIDLQFAGVGMEVALDPKTKQLKVLSPLVGSPAYWAGVRAGDRILRIDQTDTQGMTLQEAVSLLRGRVGEAVTLLVLHEGEEEPQELRIVRQVVHVPTVLGDSRNADGSWNYWLENHAKIGYIRLSGFADKTAAELEEVLQWLTAGEMQGLVLDLRDNPGGYLNAAVDVCDMFLPSGVIVTTRRRGGQISRTYTASGRGRFFDIPLAVIVNQQTASAAEIIAACLQDHKRAKIVGQRTFGKGTVQEVLDLAAGYGAMKLTTAAYWRPTGKNIQRPRELTESDDWGVKPDSGCEVAVSSEEYRLWQLWRARRDHFHTPEVNADMEKALAAFKDRQLEQAVKCLKTAAGGTTSP